jgi:AbiV family abortive infection protein
MGRSKFMELSAEECSKVYPVLQSNAERHFRIGHTIAALGEYGNAVSHLILGSEELIKAIVLFLDSKDFEIRKIKGAAGLFYTHASRHNVLKEFFSVLLFFRPVKTLDKINIGNFLLGILKGGVNAYSNYHWWEKADTLKQRGLYVDHTDSILTPSSFTENDFKIALLHVSAVRKEINGLINQLNNMTEQQLTELKEDLKIAELPDLLKETIAGRKEN